MLNKKDIVVILNPCELTLAHRHKPDIPGLMSAFDYRNNNNGNGGEEELEEIGLDRAMG